MLPFIYVYNVQVCLDICFMLYFIMQTKQENPNKKTSEIKQKRL